MYEKFQGGFRGIYRVTDKKGGWKDSVGGGRCVLRLVCISVPRWGLRRWLSHAAFGVCSLGSIVLCAQVDENYLSRFWRLLVMVCGTDVHNVEAVLR